MIRQITRGKMRNSKLAGPSPEITAYPPEYDCNPLLHTCDPHYINTVVNLNNPYNSDTLTTRYTHIARLTR